MYIDNLVETHCHILPNIDDGAKDVETSLKMIEELKNQGAKKIILTPHYYSNNISLEDFLNNREKAYNELCSSLPNNSPELILGAEVYISDYLFNNNDLTSLSFGKNNYILLEHPFSCPFEEKQLKKVESLCYDYNLSPILAHIERYPSLMNDENKLLTLLDMGCIAQVNIESFDDAPFFVKKKLFKYLKKGLITLVGSDAHNLSSRPPQYETGANKIIKKFNQETFDNLIKNANSLFEN